MKIKVKYRKLGKEQAHGIAHMGKNLIELDSRLRGKKLLGTTLHELIHLVNPDFSETKVLEQEKIMSEVLWKENWRRVER